MDLHLSSSNGFLSSKIYDKREPFDFDIVIFPFMDGDVPRRPSYGVYISQLIRFARVCSHVDDFFICCLVHRGSTDDLHLLHISSGIVWQSRDLQLSRNTLYL